MIKVEKAIETAEKKSKIQSIDLKVHRTKNCADRLERWLEAAKEDGDGLLKYGLRKETSILLRRALALWIHVWVRYPYRKSDRR